MPSRLFRTLLLTGAALAAHRFVRARRATSGRPPHRVAGASSVSGAGAAVDHDRVPGVPPPSNDDYTDVVDHSGADSFPASDPPSGW